MQHTESLATRPLGSVIEAIASDAIAPGAGSAAAVGLALAAACARKAVVISLKHHPNDDSLTQAEKKLADVTHRALRGADVDAASFREFMLEKDAASAEELVATGKHLEQLGAALLAVLDSLECRVDLIVRGDIRAARALCSAFSEIQSENVAENEKAANRV